MAILKVIHGQNAPVDPCYTEKKYHDENSLYHVIAYCCNPEKTKSGLIGGFGISLHDAAAQMDGLAQAYGKANGIRLRHMVLSFEPGERISPQKVYQVAYQLAWYYGQEYQILFAVHEDKPHRHIHFIMNTVSYWDGHKYPGTKEDYYRFHDYVREVLHPYKIAVRLA